MHTDRSTLIFVGPPNTGKTTLYNKVTGSRFKTINYPGSTTEYFKGQTLKNYGPALTVYDSPGLYSLKCKTPDEDLTWKLLFEELQPNTPHTVVAVIDATQLQRQIPLVEELNNSGFNLVVALTMSDEIKKNNITFNKELLEKKLGLPVYPINARLGEGVKELLEGARQNLKPLKNRNCCQFSVEERRQKFNEWSTFTKKIFIPAKTLASSDNASKGAFARLNEVSERIDRWCLHPFLGGLFFFSIMFLVFSSTFFLAQPLMSLVDNFIIFLMTSTTLYFPNFFGEFLADGVIAGFGAFLVFIPQIALLFLFLTLLEDTGYLARAASIMDRPLSLIGMTGRSFVPILSSFSCAVPGMLAARSIPNRRERFLALFILPLMTCSARLPIYSLIIAFLFQDFSPWIAGLAMALLYFSSALLGGVTAKILVNFLPKTKRTPFFVLELPSYRWPQPQKVLRTMYDKTSIFVRRAGPVIFVLSILIWASSTFPNYTEPSSSQRLTDSYLGQAGQLMEPIFEPMGADWRIGVGILSSFVAREVFVSTLSVMLHLDEESDENSLLDRMRLATWLTKGDAVSKKPLFNTASVSAILVFFMIALQCMATVTLARQEFGGWSIALAQLFTFNTIAYVMAVLTYQILS